MVNPGYVWRSNSPDGYTDYTLKEFELILQHGPLPNRVAVNPAMYTRLKDGAAESVLDVPPLFSVPLYVDGDVPAHLIRAYDRA